MDVFLHLAKLGGEVSRLSRIRDVWLLHVAGAGLQARSSEMVPLLAEGAHQPRRARPPSEPICLALH